MSYLPCWPIPRASPHSPSDLIGHAALSPMRVPPLRSRISHTGLSHVRRPPIPSDLVSATLAHPACVPPFPLRSGLPLLGFTGTHSPLEVQVAGCDAAQMHQQARVAQQLHTRGARAQGRRDFAARRVGFGELDRQI
eukprot:863422-Prorocentrum_minimum.AAC.1